ISFAGCITSISVGRNETDFEVALEERRVGRRRERRGAIHGGLDGLAHGLIAVALADARIRHLSARHLRHVHDAIDSRPRGRRTEPRPLNARGDLRLPLGKRAARAGRHEALLLFQPAPQIGFSLRAVAGLFRLAPFFGPAFLLGPALLFGESALLGQALLLAALRLGFLASLPFRLLGQSPLLLEALLL